MTAPALYAGIVRHVRHVKPRRKFAYRLWMLAVDLDDLDALAARSRVFRHNQFGLISIVDADHGPRDGSPLRPWVEQALTENGLQEFGARIRLMTMPRIVGYAFNPISFYFCSNDVGRLGAVLHQVKNTFADQVGYLIPVAEASGQIRQHVAKSMHVSPFFDMQGHYDFRFSRLDERFRMTIRYGADAKRMTVAMILNSTIFSDRNMLKLLGRMPLIALKVIAAIHWEAISTWVAGAKFYREPKVGHQPIILGDPR